MAKERGYRAGTETVHVVTQENPPLSQAFTALPGRAKAAVIAAVAVLVGVAAAGVVTGTLSFLFAAVGVTATAAVLVATVRSAPWGRQAAYVVAALCMVAAVASVTVDGPLWGGLPALVLTVAAVAAVVVARNFAPATHKLPAELRARLDSLPQYRVADLSVPGGAEALVAPNGTMYLLGVAEGDEPVESAGYQEFVARRARLENLLSRQEVEISSIVLAVDRDKFGPVRTDDDVVICSFSTLRRATSNQRGGRKKR
jgi:hypothetical protein